MTSDIWESKYLDAYGKVLLNCDIYLAVRDFHIDAMRQCEIVLDSGSGTGNVTRELLIQGKFVHAVDKSKKALQILEDKCKDYKERLKIYKINAEKLPFADETFNGITSMFVLNFVDDFEAYLREHYRVLRENGIFAISARKSAEKTELFLQSYEYSLRKRGLLPQLEREMEIIRKGNLGEVRTAIKHLHSPATIEEILRGIGFREIKEFPNPYFGERYSLVARK